MKKKWPAWAIAVLIMAVLIIFVLYAMTTPAVESTHSSKRESLYLQHQKER